MVIIDDGLGEGFEFLWSVPTAVLGVFKTYCVALLEIPKVKDTGVMIVFDYIFLFVVIVFAMMFIMHSLNTMIIP